MKSYLLGLLALLFGCLVTSLSCSPSKAEKASATEWVEPKSPAVTSPAPESSQAGMTPADSAPVTEPGALSHLASAGVDYVAQVFKNPGPQGCQCGPGCRCKVRDDVAPVVHRNGQFQWEEGWVWHPNQQGTAPAKSGEACAEGSACASCQRNGGVPMRVFGRRGR